MKAYEKAYIKEENKVSNISNSLVVHSFSKKYKHEDSVIMTDKSNRS